MHRQSDRLESQVAVLRKWFDKVELHIFSQTFRCYGLLHALDVDAVSVATVLSLPDVES